MSTPEELWSQIASRRPQLRESVSVYRHRYRGRRWYLLRDTATDRWQRLNSEAYAAVRLLDGERSLAVAHAAAANAHSPTPLTETELVQIVDSLQQAELIDWGVAEDAELLHARAKATRRRRRIGQWLSPLAIRVPLLDPDRLLDANVDLARLLFSASALFVTLIILAVGATAAILDWPALTTYWSERGWPPTVTS